MRLDYAKAFEREIRKNGAPNPTIRRNFYLEDTVEVGNSVSRQRLLSCGRPGGIIIPFETLFLGLDWGGAIDQTIETVGNNQNDVLDWIAYPDATALMVMGASRGSIGEILFA